MAPRLIKTQCPPGVLCITPTFIGTLIIVAAAILIGAYLVTREVKLPKIVVNVQNEEAQQVPQPTLQQKIIVKGGDDRYSRAPEPLREWLTEPDLRGALIPQGAVPIFQPARGYPDQFQQMGILSIEGTEKILPLYGRRTGNRSDRYNYYTRTDTYNPIQLPLSFERRDCMDDVGCTELFGGETIKIDGMNNYAKVKVYKYDAPRYIPAVL